MWSPGASLAPTVTSCPALCTSRSERRGHEQHVLARQPLTVFVDILSVVIRALSFIALFQAVGMALFIALFGRELSITEAILRRVGMLSALTAALLVLGHYALEAARLSGEFSGVMDPTLQGIVMHSAVGVALAWRLVGVALIGIALRVGKGLGAALGVIGGVMS